MFAPFSKEDKSYPTHTSIPSLVITNCQDDATNSLSSVSVAVIPDAVSDEGDKRFVCKDRDRDVAGSSASVFSISRTWSNLSLLYGSTRRRPSHLKRSYSSRRVSKSVANLAVTFNAMDIDIKVRV